MAPSTRDRLGNLPLDMTSFVGRRREVTEGRRLLAVSRLVTLTGIGGVGKTRLALRVAADSRRAFDDGVWLVEFGEQSDPELVPDIVAATLGLRDQVAHSPLQTLLDFLDDRQILLVLDNCEHLVDAVAKLAETLLRACPQLRILATSREPLTIGGEAAFRVPPMSAPDPRAARRGVAQYEAVTLFVERAGAAVPGFELTDDNRATVAQICRRLDGLPLPIELAAARLRAMSPAQILDRLTDRYRLLVAGTRGAPTRQQTLRMCIDWSHDLCTETERGLWRRLSVFARGFELDAAEGIAAGDLTPDDLLDVIASLVDKSILIREEPDGVVRYRLLETLRDYGLERLEESDEGADLRRRHRDWYEQLIDRADVDWIGPNQQAWILRISREGANLRAVLKYCIAEPGSAEHALTLSNALFQFWVARGALSEGRYWFDRSLDAQGGVPTKARVEALCANAVLAGNQGDAAAGLALVDEAHRAAATLDDPDSDTLVTHAAGHLAMFDGDPKTTVEVLGNILDTVRAGEDRVRHLSTLLGLAMAHALLDDVAAAVEYADEVLSITAPRDEAVYRAYALSSLGIALWQQEPARARAELEQGLRLTVRMDDPLCSAICVEVLAWIAVDANQPQRAAVLLGGAQSLWRAAGVQGVVIPGLPIHHDNCERHARRALGARSFDAAFARGTGLGLDEIVAFALEEQAPPRADATQGRAATDLTPREQEVADLVARGLTNRAIAEQLVISQRTAQGHVEHVLSKLGFTSRTQIAAWVIERAAKPADPPS
ncbi:LuxR family transcriptional regulator [Rhodococcus spelaei]|uniref:LuxR family transcriptional regulator n=1 Tax=Rhodococcus spelaei TaxID=2546320 RepID=A0A541BRN6_9NOCA|nr:LuxR C-terminal-related transcriptional regulator [Rhodococcus spelaei]TQF74973.1 LuxR family transcriptional regulator [Rhodococcus spelaei]